MQENEFEKEVRRKMEELQLLPNELVWQQVKVQVQQKRKRRLVFFLLFLLLGITAGGLLLNQSGKKIDGVKNATATVTKPVTVPETNSSGDETVNAPAANEPGKLIALSDKNLQQPAAAPGNHDLSKMVVKSKLDKGEDGKITEKRPFSQQRSVIKKIRTQKDAAVKMNFVPGVATEDWYEPVRETLMRQAGIEPVSATADLANSGIGIPVADSASLLVNTETDKKNNGIKSKKNIPAEPAAVNKSAGKKQTRNWGFGFTIAAGKTFAGYNNAETALFQSADGTSVVPGNTAGYADTGRIVYPSPSRNALGFMAGVQVYKNLSSGLKLITGLEYRYYSSSILVGGAPNLQYTGAVRYGFGEQKKYTNSYHYLSVPLGLSWNFGSIAGRGIFLDAAVDYSRLVATNALLFDTASSDYYRNTAAFNKYFIGLSAALNVNVAKRDKPAFLIGPQLNYSITPLTKTGMYGATRSCFIGFRIVKRLSQ